MIPKATLFFLCVAVSLSGCKAEKPLVGIPMTKVMTGQDAPCEEFFWGGFPQSPNPEAGDPTTSFVCREFYALNFNTVRGTSDWVLEHLTAENLTKPDAALAGSELRPDGEIPNSLQTKVSDYIGIGYQKGFFAPPDNFRFSEIAYSHSFYLTNVYPQHPGQEKIMTILETWIRQAAVKRGDLYIISGPVYENGNGLGWVGQSSDPSASGNSALIGKVQVPTAVFKVVFSPQSQKAIAFEVPNAASGALLGQLVVPFDLLEKKTGLLFFADFPLSKQASIKSGTASAW